jgi:hypothetical protein
MAWPLRCNRRDSIWITSTLRDQLCSMALAAYQRRCSALSSLSSKVSWWYQGSCASTSCTKAGSGQACAKARMYLRLRGEKPFIPVEIIDADDSHGRQVRWTLRARHATDAIRERWVGATWIVELVSTGWRDGKPFHHVHFFITTLRTRPKALLRLVRQRWAIEN